MENKPTYLFVIVLYKMTAQKSSTYQSLLQSLQPIDSNSYSLMIYDNSPSATPVQASNTIYIHNAQNEGVYAAYQSAYEWAEKNKIDYLILLDQDTNLTREYIEELFSLDRQIGNQENIVAYVPHITDHSQHISPTFSDSVSPLKQHHLPVSGVNECPIMAISSGTCLKMNFLIKVNGFNPTFTLDYLDHWLFWLIYQEKKVVYLMNATLNHHLSVLHYQEMTLERYNSILNAEYIFYKVYQTKLFPSFRRHLFLRFCKQFLFVKNKKIAWTTLKKMIACLK